METAARDRPACGPVCGVGRMSAGISGGGERATGVRFLRVTRKKDLNRNKTDDLVRRVRAGEEVLTQSRRRKR